MKTVLYYLGLIKLNTEKMGRYPSSLIRMAALKEKDEGKRIKAIKMVRDQKLLTKIVQDISLKADVRLAAVQNLENQRLIAKIILKDKDEKLRSLALFYLQDVGLLKEVAENSSHPGVRLIAARTYREKMAAAGEKRVVESVNEKKLRVVVVKFQSPGPPRNREMSYARDVLRFLSKGKHDLVGFQGKIEESNIRTFVGEIVRVDDYDEISHKINSIILDEMNQDSMKHRGIIQYHSLLIDNPNPYFRSVQIAWLMA